MAFIGSWEPFLFGSLLDLLMLMNTRLVRLLLALLLLGPALVRAQDVTGFFFLKSLVNTQSTAGVPVPDTSPYRFRASVDTAVGGLLSGSVGIPGGFTQPLISDGPDSWGAEASYRTAGALEADYPAGNYLLTLRTAHDGNKALTVGFPAGVFPNAPQVVNFAAAQAVVATSPFAPAWTAFAGGTVNDYVRFSVETADGRDVFQTSEPGKSGALNGTSTSGSIPAGTLTPGQSYTAKILFARIYGQNTDYGQGVTGIAVYYTETRFPLVAASTPDVRQIILAKGVSYGQATAEIPVTTDQPYQFIAQVVAKAADVNSASLQPPSGSAVPLSFNGSDQFRIKPTYRSQAALDADFPGGAYSFTIQAVHNGTRTVPLTLTGNSYPNAPQLVNFAAAQAVNPAAEFTISWNAFVGGTAGDYVSFRLEDGSGNSVLKTPDMEAPGALTGISANSLTVPANTLVPGTTYNCRLLFAHVTQVNSTSYGLGVNGYAAYVAQTQFPVVTAAPQDVQSFGVVKGLKYNQTSAAVPSLVNGNPYSFAVFVDSDNSGVAGGSLKLPNGATLPLFSNNGDTPGLSVAYPTVGALDASFPAGNYTVTLNTVHNGTKAVTLPLPTSAFPNAPQVLNFAALQAVDADAPLTVTWGAFTGGGANDFVQLVVSTPEGWEIFQTPQSGSPGALTGTATTATIPANLLAPSQTYQVRILFAKGIGSDQSYAPAFAAYYSQTELPLVTASGPDVKRFGLVKGIRYVQTSAGAPIPEAFPYKFNVFTEGSDGGVLGGSLRLPDLSTKALTSINGDSPSIESEFTTQALLDSIYPPGNYTLTLNTAHNGTQTAALSLSASSFPNPPMVLGFAALQAVNPDAPLTVSWNPFTGGTVNDFVEFSIRSDSDNDPFSTGGPGDSDSLNGTATSVTIPAHTLQPGRTYSVRLLFARLTASNATFAYGFSGFYAETEAMLKTTGVSDTTPPSLTGSNPANGASNVSVNSSIAFTFSEPMQPGYSINWSGNAPASNFTYAWSVDKRTLTCTYNTTLPAASEINWVLNPAQSSPNFRDLAGNPLASDIAGHFFTGGAVVVTPKLYINPNGQFWHLHADGTVGQNYLIQNATSLTPPINWQPVVNFQGTANGFDFNDGVVRERNFYRVIPAN